MTKRKLFIITLVLAVALYSVAWVYVSNYIKKVLKQEEALINKELSGDELILSGYPFDIKFTIMGENRQHPILRRIDAVSLNLFSRKISLHIKDDPSAKPFSSEYLKNIEFSMKPNTDAIYYFKLNSYSMVVNYIKNKEGKLDWIDLFNLSQETGLKGAASVSDNQTSFTYNTSLSLIAKLPGKKIYKDFNELYLDLPHHLLTTIEYTIDGVSFDLAKRSSKVIEMLDQIYYPVSGKIDIMFNLPEGVFSSKNIRDIAQNVKLKTTAQSKGGRESVKYTLSLTNFEERMKLNSETNIIYSKEYINFLNTIWSNKEEIIEFAQYNLAQHIGNITPLTKEKLRLVVDKLSKIFPTPFDPANPEVKCNIDLMIPHKPDPGTNATYNFYIGNGKKTFAIEWKGDISSVNLSNSLAGVPVINGDLSIVNKPNGIGILMEMKNLFLLGMLDEISRDIFKQRLDRFENNTILWSNMFKELSDDPQSTSGEMQYTYNIDFKDSDVMKSKFSKTSTLGDVLKKWQEVSQECNSLMSKKAK